MLLFPYILTLVMPRLPASEPEVRLNSTPDALLTSPQLEPGYQLPFRIHF